MAENNVAPMTTSCWKKSYDESGSFFDNLKNSFNVFVDTPMREHKDCFKFTWHKMVDKFSTKTIPANGEDENKATFQAETH